MAPAGERSRLPEQQAQRFGSLPISSSDTSSRGAASRTWNAKQIRRDRIVPDPDQPRKISRRSRWKNSRDRCASRGMFQPIAVWYDRGGMATTSSSTASGAGVHPRIAGMETIPAIVRDRIPGRSSDRLIDQLMETSSARI